MKRRYWTDLAKAQQLSPTKVTADFSYKIIKQRRDFVMFRDAGKTLNPRTERHSSILLPVCLNDSSSHK